MVWASDYKYMGYKNKEDKTNYYKRWIKKNPEKRRTYERTWRDANPEKVDAQKDRYYQKNKEYIKNKSREYYLNTRKQYLKEHANEERVKNRVKSQRKLQIRRETMAKLRLDHGGKCIRCGYSEEIRILQFHHNKGGKDKNVAEIQNVEKMILEAQKCVLLCPNCHATIHLKPCTTSNAPS